MLDAIANHRYDDLSDKMQGMPNKREFVEQFHKHHKDEYATLQADIRAGKVGSPSLKMAVALDTLKGTTWGSSGEGAKVVQHLDHLYDTGRITTEEDPGGLGRTDITTPGATGSDGQRADTRVVLNQGLLDSPEATATILAHEGQHSYRDSMGTRKRSLEEEVDAHMAQNAVWSGFGPEKDASDAGEPVNSLNTTATYDTRDKLYNHLMPSYLQDYMDKAQLPGQKDENEKAARGLVIDYVKYSSQRGDAPLRDLPDGDLANLTKNAHALLSGSGRTFRSSVDAVDAETPNRQMRGE
jgi:hypothetical protein